jgi:chaperonin GroES
MAKAAPAAPKIRPLGEKVLIKRLEAEDKTKGGILLPDNAKEKPQKGTVLAVGDFASYAGTEIKVGTEEYMLMDETDILAILD